MCVCKYKNVKPNSKRTKINYEKQKYRQLSNMSKNQLINLITTPKPTLIIKEFISKLSKRRVNRLCIL